METLLRAITAEPFFTSFSSAMGAERLTLSRASRAGSARLDFSLRWGLLLAGGGASPPRRLDDVPIVYSWYCVGLLEVWTEGRRNKDVRKYPK